MNIGRSIFLASACLLPYAVHGAVEKEAVTRLGASPLSGGVMLETVAGLLVILGLILGLGWFFKRFGRLSISGKGDITILGGVSLGPRERAVLLQVEGKRLLVGVAPGRVQTLHVLEDGEGNPAGGEPKVFSKQLDTVLEESAK
jgi:flagellar protein FliO/FliZ